MKLYKFFRANDWWEPKLTPLLTAVYATVTIIGVDLFTILPHLLFLIGIFLVVAIYVSVINDYADLEEDKIAGKRNRLTAISHPNRLVLIIVSLILSFFLIYVSGIGTLSSLFALGAIVCFSLYSLPPFRLKNRSVFGVIADASGSHLFPTLFFVSSVYSLANLQINITLLSIFGIWSFAYGLRGILWHQFQDKHNDVSVGLKTFAVNAVASQTTSLGSVIIIIELSALAVILFLVKSLLPIIALAGYFILLVIYHRLDNEITLFVSHSDNWYILMTDYYQVFLPVSLIILASFTNPECLLLLIFHALFFPNRLKHIAVSLFKISADSKELSAE
ncbi:UbiA family prenyltransferase [Rhodohalobacter sp. 614A]|uniref:UbiA family prenyltransferase n=1 Tax=Rhodohalobacter sp. 614A TaxID=2908649 RepID=UPI001F47ED78